MGLGRGGASRPVRVWDPWLRAFHWLLAALILVAWWTYATDRMAWHKRAGDAAAALLAFRLYWGVLGPRTARFSSFLRGPAATWRYLRGRAEGGVGHNPAGAWNIVAILALLAALIALGLFSLDREGLDPGPLAAVLTVGQARLARRLHGLAFDGLVGLVALHLAAIAAHLAKGDNLIGPMLTGRKRLPARTPDPAPAPAWSAAVGVALAAAAYLALARLDDA